MLHLHSSGNLIQRLISLYGKGLLTYTTSTTKSTSQSVADYLVHSLGFSKEDAIATSAKASSRNFKQNHIYVIDFFEQIGLDDTQIKKIVSKQPKLLKSDVEKILKPKIRVFQGCLGLYGSDLGDFIADCPPLLVTNLNNVIVPSIVFLTSLLDTKENVIKALRGSYWGFPCDFASRNVTLLQNHGVSKERIQQFVVGYPRFLRLNPQKVEDICIRAKEKLGIPVNSPMFLKVILALAGSKGENLESKYRIYESYGWSESDITTLTRKRPECLNLTDATTRSKLDFFMKKLGYESGYIASHPSLITYSLEKRVVPRSAVLQVLKESELIPASPRFYQAFTISESQFLKNYVLPFKGDLPHLYDAYVNNKMDSFSKTC